MAWTQADLDTISAAIANNVRSVTYADGRQITYQDVDKMLAVRSAMAAELTMQAQAMSGLVRRRVPYFRSGL